MFKLPISTYIIIGLCALAAFFAYQSRYYKNKSAALEFANKNQKIAINELERNLSQLQKLYDIEKRLTKKAEAENNIITKELLDLRAKHNEIDKLLDTNIPDSLNDFLLNNFGRKGSKTKTKPGMVRKLPTSGIQRKDLGRYNQSATSIQIRSG